MPSAVEDIARLRVAINIASWLMASDIPSINVASADDAEWTRVMDILRTKDRTIRKDYLPPAETRKEVAGIMVLFEERRAIVQAAHKPKVLNDVAALMAGGWSEEAARKAVSERCEHGRPKGARCIACEEAPPILPPITSPPAPTWMDTLTSVAALEAK